MLSTWVDFEIYSFTLLFWFSNIFKVMAWQYLVLIAFYIPLGSKVQSFYQANFKMKKNWILF